MNRSVSSNRIETLPSGKLPRGFNRDTAWYSILHSEWPRIRTNFEVWLTRDNFDARERQRRSLRALNASR